MFKKGQVTKKSGLLNEILPHMIIMYYHISKKEGKIIECSER